VHQSKGHGKSVDWWALGILIFEMLVGYPPFYDENPFGIYQKILAGRIEFPRFGQCPQMCIHTVLLNPPVGPCYRSCRLRHVDPLPKDLVRRLLTADKTKRIGCLRGGAEDIKNHKWFDRLNWDNVLRCTIPAPFVPKVCKTLCETVYRRSTLCHILFCVRIASVH
jgi:protein kinase X